MYRMFNGATRYLSALDVSSFNTSNVTNMSSMFDVFPGRDALASEYGSSTLTMLDLSNFDTSNVTNMYRMFHNLKGLSSVNVAN